MAMMSYSMEGTGSGNIKLQALESICQEGLWLAKGLIPVHSVEQKAGI